MIPQKVLDLLPLLLCIDLYRSPDSCSSLYDSCNFAYMQSTVKGNPRSRWWVVRSICCDLHHSESVSLQT